MEFMRHAPARRAPLIPDHTVLRWIGGGSYGEVWLGRNVIGEHRAIKVIRRENFESEVSYLREFSGIKNVEPICRKNPGVVQILHIGKNEDEGYFYYVMELADDARGGEVIDADRYSPQTLQSLLRSSGKLPVAEVVELGSSLLKAIGHLHRHNLIHRDIKPANIIFVNGQPKLADVGSVTDPDAAKSFVGTEGFVAPEGPYTKAADIYSLGKVLYECVTGHDRFAYPEPSLDAPLEQLPKIQELYEIIFRACDRDLRKRYGSTDEMQGDLSLLEAGASLRKLRAGQRRLKQMLVLAAIFLVLASAGFALQRSRAAAMQERLALVEARAAEQRRQNLLQGAGASRRLVPEMGWSQKRKAALMEAATIRKDAWLRDEIVDDFAGLDARLIHRFANFSASSVAFDLSGKRLLVGGMIGEARLLPLASDKWYSMGLSKPNRVAFSPDGPPVQLAVQGHGEFLLWNLTREEKLQDFRLTGLREQGAWPAWVQVPTAIAPDLSLVAGAACFSDGGGKYAVWNVGDGRQLLEGNGKIFSLAFSPDGSLLAAGNDHGRIEIWSVSNGTILKSLCQDRFSIRSLAFTRDKWHPNFEKSKTDLWLLAAGDERGTISFWDVSEGTVRTHLRGPSVHVYAVAFSPDGALLASAVRNEVRVWDVAAERPLLTIPFGHANTGLAFSTDGHRLAVSTQTGFHPGTGGVRVFALESNHGIRVLRGLGQHAGKIAFSRDGRWLAALAADWRIGLWDIVDGQLRHIFSVPKDEGGLASQMWLGFSPDGMTLACGRTTAGAAWSVRSGNLISSWQNPLEGPSTYAFDSSGKLLQIFIHQDYARTNDAPVSARTRVRWAIRRVPDPKGTIVEGDYEWPYEARLQGSLGRDARYLLIESDNLGTNVVQDHRFVVFDTTRGRQIWSSEPKTFARFHAALDSTGTVVAHGLPSSPHSILELASGAVLGKVPAPVGFSGPQGRFWIPAAALFGSEPGQLALYHQNSPAPIVSFKTAFAVNMSDDGSLFAFVRPDGTIALCHLETIKQQLKPFGLSWE